MYKNLDVRCFYCDYEFSLAPDEDDLMKDELYQDGDSFERECPECKKKLSIIPTAKFTYSIDQFDSDDLNDL